MKQRLYDILNPGDDAGPWASAVSIFLLVVIVLSIVAVIVETVPSIAAAYAGALGAFEIVSVAIFSVEYLLRLWVCTNDPRYAHPVLGRLRYAVSFMALIDLLAVAPFFLAFVLPYDTRVLRALRLIRLARVLKLGHYSEAIGTIGRVFYNRRGELAVAGFAVLVLLILASSLMYYVESSAQPEAFPSIPAAMWWGVATLTTIGYGDVYPVTGLGRLLGSIIGILGIGLFGLPAGILAGGLAHEIAKKHAAPAVCPHCGEPIGGHGEPGGE
jgi:voltage-gated potassium channel